ncbi:MAG: FAD/NAD(P)-binding protein [Actinomycetota bacterium]
MKQIETDYLVVGAGASGMAFTDALTSAADVEVVLVDRRHRPGGHWLDAYPFVRLHQPSACYGVASRKLGDDRIDETGPNAGCYERATGSEICDHYQRALEEDMLPSGKVRFFGMSDYLGQDAEGHRFVATLTGEPTIVKVRRKIVDTTYTEGAIPSRHTPSFEVDPDVTFIPPNDIVDLDAGAFGFTVIGAGKTSMDVCYWLLDQGVDPDRIRWIRARDAWAIDRARLQPLELVGSALEWQSRIVEEAAGAEDVFDMFHRLEAHGVFHRIDPSVEPQVMRGATLSTMELEALRQISNVVRLGKVRRIGTDRVILDEGSIPSDPGQVYVDCTAPGVPPIQARPVFEADRIVTQLVTFGIVPWGAATVGYVEAARDGDEEKNRLCPAVSYPGELSDMAQTLVVGLKGPAARMAEPDLVAWNEGCRLNPMRGAMDHLDDPLVQEALARLAANMEPALANLERMVAGSLAPASA